MQRIVPCLWFNRTAAEAVAHYRRAFSNFEVVAEHRYPTEGLPDFQQDFAGDLLTVEFEIDGYRIAAINADDHFRPNPSISLFVNFDPLVDPQAREHLDKTWAVLTEGGRELMPLGEYDFSPRYAWVEDKFGVSWQLILTNPDGDPRPTIIPNLMFGAGVQGRAKEAIDFYASVFDGKVGSIYTYPEGVGVPGEVMYADYQLLGEWFASNDGPDQAESFTCGVSLMINCDNQAEIDRYWDALSRVPEAEMCGWCADQFGVSWQVVPRDIDKLMSNPEAYQNMMKMKKFIIADL